MIVIYYEEWTRRFIAYDNDDEPNDDGYQLHGDGNTPQEAWEDFLQKYIDEG